jgi:hypothetical protein
VPTATATSFPPASFSRTTSSSDEGIASICVTSATGCLLNAASFAWSIGLPHTAPGFAFDGSFGQAIHELASLPSYGQSTSLPIGSPTLSSAPVRPFNRSYRAHTCMTENAPGVPVQRAYA